MWQLHAAEMRNSTWPTRMSVNNLIWRGSRPKQIPAKVFRDEYRATMSILENNLASDAADIFKQMLKDFILCPITTSKTAFEKLERTDISQLGLDVIATGKYLLVRCIEKNIRLGGLNTVVEDHVGNVCTLSVYNYPSKENFPPGTVLIVKEPNLLIRDNNLYGIYCFCPTDILVLRPSHPLFHLSKTVRWIHELRAIAPDPLAFPPHSSSALKWKERGNCFFDKNEMILAREAYFLGLKLCKDEDVKIEKLLKLNIIAVHLKLKYYEKAIELGNEILENFPNEKKVLFRLGKAYYAVRKFEDAFHMFERFCQQFPDEMNGTAEFRRVQERIKERNGNIDLEKLRRLAKDTPLHKIDCADYDGPIVIKEIADRERGLVLTKDVKKNTILMVNKALAATLYPAEIFPSLKDIERIDDDSARVMFKLAKMISRNPNVFGPPVFSLYSSGGNSSNVEEPFQLFCDPKLQREPICDMEKLRAIFDQKSFRILNRRNARGKGMGLFILPSYMKQSCELNVDYEFYNDVIVFTAMADLKAGTELTTSFINEDLEYGMRTMMLDASGLNCDCNKCKRRI